jgi:sugar phosphate isomerase/epimerase
MHRIALAHLTVVGLTPPEIIRLAAELGCEGVALNPALAKIDLGRPLFRIDNDPAMRRQTAQALAETGVTIDLIDSFVIAPDFSLADATAVVEVFTELGTSLANVVPMDHDAARRTDNLAALAEVAKAHGMTLAMEFAPLGGPLPSLKEAVALVTSGSVPGLKILIDSLHLARAGESPADVAAVDPSLIAAMQICDGPLVSPGLDAYRYEALFERTIPGEGELPLRALLDVIPANIAVSPEVPLKSLRDQGISVQERARRVVEGVRRLQETAPA